MAIAPSSAQFHRSAPGAATLVVVAAVVGTAFAAASAAGASRGRVFRVQLDHDAPLERVGIQRVRCREPFPCSRLLLRDGRVRRRLTGISQQPRYPYHWSVDKVRFIDMTGDGVPEIAWSLQTVGATTSSPSLKGVDGWDGRRRRKLFRIRNATRAPRPYAYVIVVTWKIVPGDAGGLPEIETSESLHRRNDPTCCPSAYRITRHRWDGRRIAPVPGSSHIVPAR